MTTKEKKVIEKVISEISHFLDIHCKEQERLVTLTRREYIITIRWNNTDKAFDVENWRYGSCIATSTMSIDKLVAMLLYSTKWDYDIYCLECQINNEKSACILPQFEPILLDEYYRNIRKENKINSELDKNLIKGESVAKGIKEEKENIMAINHYENLKQLLQLHNTIKNKDTRKVIFYKAGIKNTPELILYKINDDDFDLIAANNNKIYSSLDYENAFNMIMERIKNKEIYYEF